MFFRQFKVGDMENFCYVFGDESGGAAVVDPGWEADKILDEIKKSGLTISHILLTHTHYDHITALKDVWAVHKVPVYVHASEKDKVETVDASIEIKELTDGMTLSVGSLSVEVLHTPGHSPGSVCFVIDGKKMTSGDTLFVGSIGRVDLPGSNPDEMKASLARLKELDDALEVYPGHDYGPTPSSTMKWEKENNPFLK